MKKGDLLLCNDGVTEVEIVEFDHESIIVAYNGNLHKRHKSSVGKSLHYQNQCWQCGSRVTSLYCERCDYCGWYICRDCGSCHQGECVYSAYGFDENGIHRNGTRFSNSGYDVEGYDRDGYNNYGIDREGYNRDGYNKNGYDRDGYNKNGYDVRGFNRDGIHLNGTRFSDHGYDCEGYNREGYKNGYNREGYNYRGFNSEGIHLNGTRFSDDGYDRKGYDKDGYNDLGYDEEGYDRQGYKSNGYNRNGYNRLGFDKDGYNRLGYDRNGYDKNGYDFDGYDRKGFDKNGYDKNGYDKNGLDAHWKSIVHRKVEYIFTLSDGSKSKKRGTITRCFVKDKVHYVDIKFKDGLILKNVEFSRTRKRGALFLLKKKNTVLSKVHQDTKTSKTIISSQIESDKVKEIFSEMQEDYDICGEYRMGFGGCYCEDDRESEYYNPVHPDDEQF